MYVVTLVMTTASEWLPGELESNLGRSGLGDGVPRWRGEEVEGTRGPEEGE